MTVQNDALNHGETAVGAVAPPIYGSVFVFSRGGSAAAPGAGAAVLTIPLNTGAAVYEVEIWVGTTGEALVLNNMELRSNGAPVNASPLLVPSSGAAPLTYLAGPQKFQVSVPASSNMTVTAIAAATAASVYYALGHVRKIGVV